MVLWNIDISSGVLGDVNSEEVKVFAFVGDLLLIIHELLFLLLQANGNFEGWDTTN